jgi:hypothetical protein
MLWFSLWIRLVAPDAWAAAPADMMQAAWQAPTAGEVAPNFTLTKLGGGTWTLSDWRDKRPVVLIFGSFT